MYCSWLTGEEVNVFGNYAVLTFQSYYSFGRTKFFLRFDAVPPGKYSENVFIERQSDKGGATVSFLEVL